MAIDVKCPIKYFEDNLIFTIDGACWAAYEVAGYEYDFLNSNKKIDLVHQLALFVSGVYSQAKALILPSRQNIEDNFKDLKKQLRKKDPLYSAALYHATEAEPYLKEEASTGSTYRTFVVFRLLRGDDTDFVISRLKDLFETFVLSINRVNTSLGADTADISTRRLNSYRKTAEKIQQEQTRRLQITPTTTPVTQWLFTRCMYRGLPQEAIVPQINLSDKRDVLALFRGRITKNNRALCISHSNKAESHQAFLVIRGLPTSSSFPGSEWIYFGQRLFGDDGLPCNTEIILNIEKIEYRKALGKIRRQRRQAKEQFKEVDDADADMPQNLEESNENISSLEAELRSGRFPLLETSVVFCLADQDKEEMEKKTDFVRQEYEDAGYFVERPYATQLNLFMSYFPGTTGITKDYVMKLPPYVVASGIFGVNNSLGSIVGPPVGWTVNPNNRSSNPKERDPIERVFKLDMREAIQNNKSGSLFITGDLGYGKSMLTKLLIYLHVLYFRARAFIFDPKNECNDWELSLPSLAGLIATVRMSSDPEYQGMMDPFALFDINTAIEVVHNILVDILHLQGNNETALTAGLEVIRDDPAPSMLRLAEILDTTFINDSNTPEYLPSAAKDLAFKIRLKKNAGMCRLLIGDGKKTLKLDNRINILQIQGLKNQLPRSTKPRSDYTEDERIATSLMNVAAKFSLKFLENNKDVLRILGYDEAWAIKDTETGANLINSASRTGRSLYSLSILNGHSIDDLPGGAVHNTITYFACFHTNEQEAIKVLDFLGLEKTEENVKLITTLKNGQCLFRDMDGNIGIVQVDLIYEDIIEAFGTTPQETQVNENEAV